MGSYIALGLVAFGMLVEIVPVKWSPLSWFGSRINKTMNDRLDNLERKVDEIDIETIRNRILNSEARLRKGETFSEKQWENLYCDITKWNDYHKTYENLNGFLKVTIENIDEYYKKQTINKDN